MTAKLLIVDDEVDFRESIALYFLDAGYTVFEASNGREGLEVFQRERPDLVFTDLRMPVLDGFQLIAELSRLSPATPVVVISGVGLLKEVVHAMRLGARDYLVKPILDMDTLKLVLMRTLRENSLIRELDSLKEKLLRGHLSHPQAFETLRTQHPSMIALMQYLEAIAASPEPVLICGETGTGKELLARAVHEVSERKGAFVSVNVSGLDDQMFTDTLFGHVKGAFSGADQRRPGLLVQAEAGTIFLDEIGDLCESSQIKLLRLLQEREYYSLGSDTPRRTDARIVAATNRELKNMVQRGTFRADLYYRLFAHQVLIPPLREREGDIPVLLELFLAEASRTLGKKQPTCPPELCSYLAAYHFPGNVRELRALVFDAVARHGQGGLSLESFRQAIGCQLKPSPAAVSATKRSIVLRQSDEERMPTLEEAEAVLIEQALELASGNQGIAAAYLGISRNALNKKIIRARPPRAT